MTNDQQAYYNAFRTFDYVHTNDKEKSLWIDGKPDFEFEKKIMGHGGDVPLLLTSSQYEIVATMGSSHACEIKVAFAPKDKKNLAPRIREMIMNKQI